MAALFVQANGDAAAVEYFGEFKDPLKGEFVSAEPRPRFKISNDFRYQDPNGLLWSVPSGSEVDGASIPQSFWSVIGGPFEGEYIRASVIHDHYCQTKDRTAHDTHRNFYYGMRAAGVVEWKAKFMYWAVDLFGPSWEVVKRIVQTQTCINSGGQIICDQVPVLRDTLVSVIDVDLSDPDTLAAALSKAATVARTLKTTSGKSLDVTQSGTSMADLESITKSAANYRELFKTKEYLANPAKLGVLSKWENEGFQGIDPWKFDRLPKYIDSKPLTPKLLEKYNAGEPFRFNKSAPDVLTNQMDLKANNFKYMDTFPK